ncbi:hypothetical protein HYG86_08100 [Alkalicella caledoniensis]|uniref:Uncharacterized protein n=1 Tax=Alkalicella caledoniensis TaxID=2731377 RepID=A0A7G9W7T8_ALKCA|nr:hypothetical protein [Alkalicella caledoniensis]QNO14750.1 hypothetical protein HYG86_08100 [Alkalicella caledoniensis]
MDVMLIVLVFVVLVIDFSTVDKDDKNSVYFYGFLVSLIIGIALIDKYNILPVSPLEALVELMTPVTSWLENILQ